MSWAKIGRWSRPFGTLLIAASTAATTIVMPSDDQLIEKTPTVLVGSVLESSPVDRGGSIWTETSIRVERILKGSVANSVIVVEEAGGALGNRRTVIFGSPTYKNGERVLVFLLPSGEDRYRTRDLFAGKFTERVTTEGRRVWYRPTSPQGTLLLDQAFERHVPSPEIRDRELFERYVTGRARGDNSANASYFVSGDLAEPLHSSFSLIDPPEVYRWFDFEEGSDVEWYTVGAQPGYSSGGVTDLARAMSAWTGYSHALIRYSYFGSSPSPAGGLFEPNGINEVMFEDPLDEIDGRWTGGSGVLGRGGFNQVADETRPWRSGFYAGENHPRQTYQAWVITEGNLVIQNGVAPGTAISSSTFAELLAHELGHTLGIGHTGSSKSLMNGRLSRIGPVLAPDDEDAARWLYPNGTFPERPTAPGNLSATLVGPTTVAFDWNDSSDNEDAMILHLSRDYVSTESELGPNTTETTVSGLRRGSRYTAYVVAWNLGGSSDRSNVVAFEVPEAQLEADFSVSPDSGFARETAFEFVNESSGTIASQTWTFGDGWTSVSSRPTHTYSLPGTFTVTLTVESPGGQKSSVSRQLAVLARPEPVVASFVFSPESPRENEAVSFEDRSTGSPTWWKWSSGGAVISSEQNPVIAFSGPGLHAVTLEAGNSEYSSAFTRSILVESNLKSVESIIPVAGRLGGVGSVSWRTDLSVFNPWDYPVEVEFQLISNEASGRARTIILSPGSTRVFDDVMEELFDITSGTGAMKIVTSTEGDDASVRVAARIFTDGPGGTYGQFVGLAEDLADEPIFLTGMRSGADFRTNLGVINPGLEASTLTLRLLDAKGQTLGKSTITVKARGFVQQPLAAVFSVVGDRAFDNLSLVASSDRSPMHVYASIVDNRSNDPVLHQPVRRRGATRLWIPVVGRTEGSNGTFWMSDVAICSPSDELLEIELSLLSHGAARPDAGRTLSLEKGESVRIDDVIEWLGVPTASGALEVRWKADSDGPVAVSRTYTRRPEDLGTFGQAIGPVFEESLRDRLFLTGVRTGHGFRTNIGFLNTSSMTIEANVTLLDRNGASVATRQLQLTAFEQRQQSVDDLFPKIDSPDERFSLRAEFSEPTVFLYASATDNDSGDPTFISGQ